MGEAIINWCSLIKRIVGRRVIALTTIFSKALIYKVVEKRNL